MTSYLSITVRRQWSNLSRGFIYLMLAQAILIPAIGMNIPDHRPKTLERFVRNLRHNGEVQVRASLSTQEHGSDTEKFRSIHRLSSQKYQPSPPKFLKSNLAQPSHSGYNTDTVKSKKYKNNLQQVDLTAVTRSDHYVRQRNRRQTFKSQQPDNPNLLRKMTRKKRRVPDYKMEPGLQRATRDLVLVSGAPYGQQGGASTNDLSGLIPVTYRSRLPHLSLIPKPRRYNQFYRRNTGAQDLQFSRRFNKTLKDFDLLNRRQELYNNNDNLHLSDVTVDALARNSVGARQTEINKSKRFSHQQLWSNYNSRIQQLTKSLAYRNGNPINWEPQRGRVTEDPGVVYFGSGPSLGYILGLEVNFSSAGQRQESSQEIDDREAVISSEEAGDVSGLEDALGAEGRVEEERDANPPIDYISRGELRKRGPRYCINQCLSHEMNLVRCRFVCN